MNHASAAAIIGFLLGCIFRNGVRRARKWVVPRSGVGRWTDKDFTMLPELAAVSGIVSSTCKLKCGDSCGVRSFRKVICLVVLCRANIEVFG